MSTPSTATGAIAFSKESRARIATLVSRYKEKRAALIPTLWVAQEQFGWISTDVMSLIAEELGIPESWVYSTATFYTMFHKHPIGALNIQVCTNIACYLRGSDELMAVVTDELGIGPGESTADGKFHCESVQCLAACGFAPAMIINKDDHFNVTPEQLRAQIRELRGSAVVSAATPPPLTSDDMPPPPPGDAP